MVKTIVRLKESTDNAAVAALIRDSLNVWYREHMGVEECVSSVEASSIFTRVYDALDPNCCVVAEDLETGRIAGSCFFHPRPTHVSLGIMNVSPDYFGQGVASKLLAYIVDVARRRNQTLRLVSSAMNLDSFSLYNRLGFVPRIFYQDMLLPSPAEGVEIALPEGTTIRDATRNDVPKIVELEMELLGVDRAKDYRFFVDNADGIWGVSVLEENATGAILGVMASVNDPGSKMIGPGAARNDAVADALIRRELNRYRGEWSPVVLIPGECVELRKAMYRLGAKNIETHIAQSLGEVPARQGVIVPSFMPESA